ncbi:MAG: condensation domain-containing protein [Pseudonocardiaceae bacterium]
MTDRARTIQAMVANIAGSNPTAIALCAPGRRSLSYAAMAAQFDNVGEVLVSCGLGPGDRVVGQVPDGPGAAMVCLVVTNACAYAPLAPGLTVAEVAAALDVLDPAAVLVAEDLDTPLRRLAAERNVTLLELRTPADAPAGTVTLACARREDATPRAAITAPNTALLLTTSGTTSRPKLVPLSHRNLVVSAHSIARTLGLSRSDRCLNVMPLFHIHGPVAGVFASLAVGASVSCAAPFDPQALLSWLRDEESTWYTAVPTMHHAVASCADGTAPQPGRLRLVRSASASLPAALVANLEAMLGVPVLEAYGMTEAAHEIASNLPPPARRKHGTVGVPTGCEVAILDEAGERCGVGVPGEVMIRGPGVMAGYVANPQANAAAFVAGWLRTGDQGVFDGDGFLTLTGRLKEMINRGGEKVSPQEVEKALLAHPQIRQAAVFAIPHPTLGQEVAAAVVCDSAASVDEQAIRASAARRLSSYKVPRRIVLVDELPTGPTGKVQRLTLANALGLDQSSNKLAPLQMTTSPLEAALTALWSRLLGVDPIGLDDNFFLLGGDSILATRLLAELRDVFLAELDLTAVFGEASTVTGMAKLIQQTRREAGKLLSVPPLLAVQRESELPLSFAQQRLWFIEQLIPGNVAYNLPMILRLRGTLNVAVLSRALDEIVTRHEILRTGFPTVAGKPVQVVGPPSVGAGLRVTDLRALELDQRQAQTMRLITAQETQTFDLATGPLLRIKLVRLADDEQLLLVTMHHIIFDGWSRELFLGEMGTLYDAFIHGQPSPLPPLTLQYADYTLWQRTWLHGEVLDNHLAYWRAQLTDAPTMLTLPTNRARPKMVSHRSASHTVRIGPEVHGALVNLARSEGVTLYMTLLAAFQLLLSHYTGSTDIMVVSPIARRTRTETEPLIGFFATPLVLRTDLSGDPTFTDLLTQVRHIILDAHAHQDLPFQQVVDILNPTRDPSRNLHPVQVSFQLFNAPRQELSLTGLTVTRLPRKAETSFLDLTLRLVETNGELNGQARYRTDLFDETTIIQLMDRFTALLQAVTKHPQWRVSQLDLTYSHLTPPTTP